MLKKRIIPKLQLKKMALGADEREILVTTVRFDEIVLIGDPISQAKIYQDVAADELIFLDLDATLESRSTSHTVVAKAARQIFMPFTVGGGIRTLADIRLMLESGADKVAINSAAVDDPTLIDRASKFYGSQCIVLSIDYRQDELGRHRVWTRGGTHQTELGPLEWALEGERRGAGEILLTSIDRDGTRQGLDTEMTRRVAEAVSIPVIASGGCGLAAHFGDGFLRGRADAVAAGTFFCFKDENPMQARAQLRNAGIPIRDHR